MSALIMANLLALLHLLFVLFVMFGGLLLLRWRKLIWLHLPVALWGAAVELGNFLCPLTPLENRFLRQAGEAGYRHSFSEEYLLPLIYPDALTRELQLMIGGGVILVNLLIYGVVYFHRRR